MCNSLWKNIICTLLQMFVFFWCCRSWSQNEPSWRVWFPRTWTGWTNKSTSTAKPHSCPLRTLLIPVSTESPAGPADSVTEARPKTPQGKLQRVSSTQCNFTFHQTHTAFTAFCSVYLYEEKNNQTSIIFLDQLLMTRNKIIEKIIWNWTHSNASLIYNLK